MSWWRRCVTGLHVHLWMLPRPPPRRIFFCQDRENREVNFKKVSRLNFIFWKWGIRKATNFNFSPVAPTKKLWERSGKWRYRKIDKESITSVNTLSMLARRVFGRDAYWQSSATFNNKAQPLQKKTKEGTRLQLSSLGIRKTAQLSTFQTI